MEHLSSIYFGEMFTSIEKAFDDINSALAANREELKDMSYRTQINAEEMPEPSSPPGAEAGSAGRRVTGSRAERRET